MKCLSTLDWIALVILLVGGLNWGLIGVFNLNLVSWTLGDMSVFSRIIYSLVGLSAIYICGASFGWGREE